MGAGPLQYQWRFNGTNLPNATNATLVLTNARVMDTGNYTVAVSNAFGVAISSNAFLGVTVSLADALDGENLNWTTYSYGGWLGTTNITRDGVDAAENRIPREAVSVLETAVTGPGTITFWWKFRPIAGGRVSFQVDHVEQAWLSTATEWAPVSFQVTQGSHSVGWIHIAGYSSFDPSGGLWLDEFFLLDGAPVFTWPPSNTVVDVGATATLVAGAAGTPPMSYQWRFNGINLALETNALLTITNA
jgi:hypothetical protein